MLVAQLKKSGDFCAEEGVGVHSVEQKSVSALTIDEIREAQLNDPECTDARRRMAVGEATPYKEDERGLIVRVADIDGTIQILVPLGLRQRVLYLSHYTPLAGHPGITKPFYTMRQTFYWPSMSADVRKVSQNCDVCAQERIKLRTHSAPLKLFPAQKPLEFVAIDILGPLERAAVDGSRYILVMTDRFSKLTKAVPLKKITAHKVAQAFLEHWCFNYEFPAILLSDNGSQFTAALFKTVCTELGIRQLFTTAYHPQTNGQVERFNRTILAGIRAFRADNPKYWPELVPMLTYAYNTQVHTSIGVTPFQLVLSRPPGSVVLRQEPNYEDGENRPRLFLKRFTAAVKELAAGATEKLTKAQERYKRDFDKRVRPLTHAKTGDMVYVSREQPTRASPGDNPRKHKLSSKAIGPFEVLDSDQHTVTVLREDGFIERVTRNRTSRAPKRDQGTNRTAQQNSEESPGKNTREVEYRPGTTAVRTPGDEDDSAEYHVVDRVIKYLPEEDKFLVRWAGYGPTDDTMEPPSHLRWNTMVQFFRSAKKKIPNHLYQYRPGRTSIRNQL